MNSAMMPEVDAASASRIDLCERFSSILRSNALRSAVRLSCSTAIRLAAIISCKMSFIVLAVQFDEFFECMQGFSRRERLAGFGDAGIDRLFGTHYPDREGRVCNYAIGLRRRSRAL